MLPLKFFGVAVVAGALLATPLVWASWPGKAPIAAPSLDPLAPGLPEPIYGQWIPAGHSSDAVGRLLTHGYRWLPKGDLRGVGFELAQRWQKKSLQASYQNTEDGGLFMSAVDLKAGHQESFLLQPGAGGLSVWVTVAGLDTGPPQNARGPATGGMGERVERWIAKPLAEAAIKNGERLEEQGWLLQPLSDETKRQMMTNGALVRYWTKDDRTLQELVHQREGGSQLQLTTLPRQMDREP